MRSAYFWGSRRAVSFIEHCENFKDVPNNCRNRKKNCSTLKSFFQIFFEKIFMKLDTIMRDNVRKMFRRIEKTGKKKKKLFHSTKQKFDGSWRMDDVPDCWFLVPCPGRTWLWPWSWSRFASPSTFWYNADHPRCYKPTTIDNHRNTVDTLLQKFSKNRKEVLLRQ